MKILVVMGTRPEVIKLAPVILELKKRPGVECFVVFTGQHPKLGREELEVFGIIPDVYSSIPYEGDLAMLVSAALARVNGWIDGLKPDWVIVQGDTASALAGALSAFYHKVPLVHVEAGLRTYDNSQPYPEEAVRRSIDVMADLMFAPTEGAGANLRLEALPGTIHTVGNTVIDALLFALAVPSPIDESIVPSVLVTTHRRENWAHAADIAKAILKLSLSSPWENHHFLYSVHPNPIVSDPIKEVMAGSRIEVRTGVDYVSWCHLMKQATLIITDSGGIQEEAAYLGVPVALFRKKTERPEGGAIVVDWTSQYEMENIALSLRDRPLTSSTKFGDGTAAIKIVDILLKARTWQMKNYQ